MRSVLKSVNTAVLLFCLLVPLAGCKAPVGGEGESRKLTIRMCIWGSPAMDSLEALATEYNLQHPDRRVVIELQTGQTYETWMTIQMISSAPPAIMQSQWYWSWDYARKGKLRPFDEYLSRVNPYTGQVWRDQFYQGRLDSVRDPHGRLYIIPHDQVKTAMYYNVDIFNKVGVKPPSTWAEFQRISQKIKEAGYIPVGVANSSSSGIVEWNVSVFFDSIYRDEIPLLDVIRPDGIVDKEESIRGYVKGIIDPLDDQYKEIWRIFKDWSRYWEIGFNAVDSSDLSRLFLQSRVAMIMDGSWRGQYLIPDIADLPEDEQFEFSMFPLPNITAESSKYTHVPLGSVGSVGAGYVIPSAISDEVAEAAVDWLMWLIRPGNMGLMYENTAVKTMCEGRMLMVDVAGDIGDALGEMLRRHEAEFNRWFSAEVQPGVAGPACPVGLKVAVGEPTTDALYADIGYRASDATLHFILGPPGSRYGDRVELSEPLVIVGRMHGDPELFRDLPAGAKMTLQYINPPLNLPCMKGVKLRREHEGFIPLMDGTFPDLRIVEGAIWPDTESRTYWFRAFQEYMAGDITLDEFSHRMVDIVKQGVKRHMDRYAYDTSKW